MQRASDQHGVQSITRKFRGSMCRALDRSFFATPTGVWYNHVTLTTGLCRVMRHVLTTGLLIGLLLMPSGGGALTGDITHDPADVVKKYAKLDFKGVRLEAGSGEVLHPYIAWTEEPVWGTVVVVDSYEVLDRTKDWDIISMMEAVIPVDYRVLGTMYWATASFLPEPRVERVRFRVKGRSHRWRLLEPHMPPHVGVKRMINFVRHAILQETDPSRLEKLTELRDDLRKAK